MPSSVTYVAGSCTATCSVVGNTVTWDLGTLTVGSSGSKSYQVTVNAGTAGSTFTNLATIRSAETDSSPADNDSSVTTTVPANTPTPVPTNTGVPTATNTQTPTRTSTPTATSTSTNTPQP